MHNLVSNKVKSSSKGPYQVMSQPPHFPHQQTLTTYISTARYIYGESSFTYAVAKSAKARAYFDIQICGL